VDRGKPGSKMHVLPDANGLPLVVGVSAGNTHDSEGLKPMVVAHQTRQAPDRGRHFKPQPNTTHEASPDLKTQSLGELTRGVRVLLCVHRQVQRYVHRGSSRSVAWLSPVTSALPGVGVW
jgi:hypothetical protein